MSEMTREEALAHFGVKGMHWGQHKAETSTGSGSSGKPASMPKPKKPTRDEILTARAIQRHLAEKSWDLHDQIISATTEKGRIAAAKALKDNADRFDAVDSVAKRMTGREKVGATLAWAGVALVITAKIAAGAAKHR